MINIDVKKQLNSSEGNLDLQVNFNISKGQLLCLFGASGSGKTSILRMICGLMKPDEGQIIKGAQILFDSQKKINMAVQKRKIGFLSQDYSLFPNMTVVENLKYGLDKGENPNLINSSLELLGLKGLEKQKPNQLSGGQKQRLALGRSIVNKPDLLLLDEPLSALDGQMRSELQSYILKIHKEFDLSIVLVTHDVSEILKLSDVVHILENGKIIRSGTAEEVFLKNKISAKYQFSGEIVNVEKQGFISILHVQVGQNLIKAVCENSEEDFKLGDKVSIASKAFNPIVSKIHGA
ncbi:MAG: ATP-binding cassette domain-containing protein [Cytophagales bacterium]